VDYLRHGYSVDYSSHGKPSKNLQAKGDTYENDHPPQPYTYQAGTNSPFGGDVANIVQFCLSAF
jgi:hypothetical protein